jgi:hypothetical protein
VEYAQASSVLENSTQQILDVVQGVPAQVVLASDVGE